MPTATITTLRPRAPFLPLLVVLTMLAVVPACGRATSGRTAATPSRPQLNAAAAKAPDSQRFLDMFARGYYPGRSGQIFVIPSDGDIITDRDPLYGFMHGSPWEYDVHIPLLLHGAPFIRAGVYPAPALQQDVAPTLGALIGAPRPATTSGRVLDEALTAGTARPALVVLMVLDAMRADYFDRAADIMPTLTRLRREGGWFPNTRINYLPTLTSVGHATIGTGADPRVHGLSANNLFNRVTGKAQPAYEGLNPGELMALTLADAWNLATDGKAIIIGQGGAIRATAGLIGHGSCLVGARPVIATSYNTANAGWETNPTCYRMPEYLKAVNGKPLWEAADGKWMNHDISNPSKFRASSLFQRLEADAIAAIVTNEALGADDVTDLLFVNMKGPDYVAHAYGPDAPEMREELAELDRQMARLLDLITRKVGAGRTVLAITADHGMPSEPPPGRRHYTDEIVTLLHQRFDPDSKKVVQYYGDAANGQIYMDTERLKTLGFSLRAVAQFLATQNFLAAVFTEDDVRAAGVRLK